MRFIGSLVALATTCVCVPAMAQINISAQAAGISSAGSTITAMRVPVQNGSDPVQYFDVTITLAPTANGSAVTGVAASATSTPSEVLQTRHFVAGTYMGSDGALYAVSGPGAGVGGATAWSIVETSGKNCFSQGTWYTATGTANPEYQRLKAVGITSSAYSFGVQGVPPSACTGNGYNFFNGTLLGAVQSGNSLVISSFSYATGPHDTSTPQSSLTLTLQ